MKAEFKTYNELQIGDQFLTVAANGDPIKLTVKSKKEIHVEVEEIGLDVMMEGYYVVSNINE